MTIGYRCADDASCPQDLARMVVPRQRVAAFDASGPQPDTLVATWQSIWQSALERSFAVDFDIYDAASPDRAVVHVGVEKNGSPDM